MEIIRLNRIDSTNTYAKNLLAENKITHPCCIVASHQTAGKGMQENKWESEANSNLTFSLICFPGFLKASRQFQLNKAISLSVYDLIKKTLPYDKVSIKWPNDIYIGDKKVAGILIESSVIGPYLNWVVIGIGINVNQVNFPDNLPMAVSLIHFSKRELDRENLLNTYLCLFHKRYVQLADNKHEKIDKAYLKEMFRFGNSSEFIYQGHKITATITGVNEFGWLQIVTTDNRKLECNLKEITFLI